jgi:hypothetical protein
MDRIGAVAVRTELKTSLQLGGDDEVNRQAEMANLTKGKKM